MQNKSLNCTCGRNYGMSNEEHANIILNDIFGEDTRTEESKEFDKNQKMLNEQKELDNQKEYLTKHNIDFLLLDVKDIEKTYNNHVRDNMSNKDKQKQISTYATNYNVMRILRGWKGSLYSN